ncbi:energy-coupling factor ABC transporter permease [Patescibacteria group bacterium]|nr:energy-coupling factor ABC transporter permease [Patescibacteria group bacterium]
MHLPDGFLSDKISFGLIAVAVGFLAVGFSQLKIAVAKKVRFLKQKLALADGVQQQSEISQRLKITSKGKEKIQLMAVLGSLIFALQMINFPVANGTSGHLIGGVLAAVVLGPWAGLLVISAVLVIQSLVFADGGVIALGANIFNMGIIACVAVGYFLYKKLINFTSAKFKMIIIGLTAWFSVVAASFCCALEIGLSGTVNLGTVTVAMIKVHLVIGIGEALLTVLIIKLLRLKLNED